ncbi:MULTISPECIES: hypothetical protein [unclassified Streptomyces]|uniref:hypothetical protein n=1 Tax=unclassified Streptomyces TaxID=2593676 RepID=UPI00036F8359|nr:MULTISPECIES: hypothetical protein [unclassified Streptomyces]MYX36742.1 hypothetical protein [Streptomyces sp. SID8377]
MTSAHPTPPPVGRNASVRIVDEDTRDDLAILMRPGGTASDAIRAAIRHMADAYRAAWDYGDVPDGTAPCIISVRYARPDGTPAPIPSSHPAHPQVREAATDRNTWPVRRV